jgi:hypothetical protein
MEEMEGEPQCGGCTVEWSARTLEIGVQQLFRVSQGDIATQMSRSRFHKEFGFDTAGKGKDGYAVLP